MANIFKTADNAEAQLNAGISPSALIITLGAGEGALFPNPKTGTTTSAGTSTTLNSTGIQAKGVAVGDIIENATDSSIAVITSVSTDSATTTELSGGGDNTWQNSDEWFIDRFIVTLNSRDENGAITVYEKVFIDSRNTDILIVNSAGRGFDGDDAQTWNPTPEIPVYVSLFVRSKQVESIKELISQDMRNLQQTRDTYISLLNARNWKTPVKVATTGPGTLASDFDNGSTIDNIIINTGDDILIKDQVDGSENGVYRVNASGAPTRREDFDENVEIIAAVVAVEQGDENEDNIWILTTDEPQIGVDDLLFQNISSGLTSAQAAILTGGTTTDASSLHTHIDFEKVLGVGFPIRNKSFINFSIQWAISTNVPSGDFWLNTWNLATGYLSHVALSNGGGGNASIITESTILPATWIRFSSNKIVICEFMLAFLGTGGVEGSFGLCDGTAPLSVFDGQTGGFAGFSYDTAGVLYAHTSANGVGHTEVDISSGLTLTDPNTYRIEFDPVGGEVRLYVNGILKATITTNLPSGTGDVRFGIGTSGDGKQPRQVTVPYFSVEK